RGRRQNDVGRERDYLFRKRRQAFCIAVRVAIDCAIQALSERLRQEGRRPYFVHYGVSNALGAVGYASTTDEIATQSSACGFHPSAIVHCTGSAATQAGLVVGASIALKGTRVIGIDIDAEPERVRSDVVKSANAASGLLEVAVHETNAAVIPV